MDQGSKENLEELAKEILKVEYHSVISVWLSNAIKAEIKGLKIASIVCKQNGLKRFKPQNVKGIHEMPSSHKNIFKYQSQYNEAYSENIIQKATESEVLKYVKLSNLPISRTLKPESLMFLERWLEIGDSNHYQTLLLSFLRAFISVCNINNSSPKSINHEDYVKKPIERNTVYARKKFFNEEPRIKLPEIHRHKSQEQLVTKVSFVKDIKTIVNKDHKDMIKWVPGVNTFRSMYQDTFHGRSVQFLTPMPKDFYISTSIKLLPDLPQMK